MNLIKKYKAVIIIVLPLLILILFRSFGANHFKSDTKRWAKPSVLKSNIISTEQAAKLSGNKLIINLDEKPNILNTIRKHDGPVLLFSSETGVSARIWMVLSQMGYEKIFILSNDADSEILKSKFRPDTLVRPEL